MLIQSPYDACPIEVEAWVSGWGGESANRHPDGAGAPEEYPSTRGE